MSTSVINTSSLTYRYSPGVETISDINLLVRRGDIYGFLGPNGSGKTTTLSLLLGLLKNQNGSIRLFGKDFNASNRVELLRKVGSLIESPSLYGHLSARENLEIYRRIYGLPAERPGEVLEIVGLSNTARKTVRRFSLGMKQRLALALALLHRPELLLLDEPTNGLDPQGIVELREIIKRLNREQGTTVLVSSHILSEVEKLVTHLGIIFRGRLLFQGSIPELRLLQQKQSRLMLSTSDDESAMRLLGDLKPEKEGDLMSVCFHDNSNIAEINRKLVGSNIDVYLLHPRKNDLEQLFIELTSNQS